jgi:hypothetical protein
MHTKNDKCVGNKQTLHPKHVQKITNKMGKVSLLLRKGGQDNLRHPNPRKIMALGLESSVDS